MTATRAQAEAWRPRSHRESGGVPRTITEARSRVAAQQLSLLTRQRAIIAGRRVAGRAAAAPVRPVPSVPLVARSALALARPLASRRPTGVRRSVAALSRGLLVGALGVVGALFVPFSQPHVDDGVALRLARHALPTAPPIILPLEAPIQVAAVAPVPEPPEVVQMAIDAPAPQQCRVAGSPVTTGPLAVDFAEALVAAARSQMAAITIYDARYIPIAYPGGDVSPLTGVCTDVVIRAYRALGIDLQVEVRQRGLGRGDSSIDHRRTETLRRFLAQAGHSRPISQDGEDYAPGDIVTYHRPQNRQSTSHIAIVSDRIGASGKLMIIHNRGHGVQEEDALFVDRITGVYRYYPNGGVMVATRAPDGTHRSVVASKTLLPVAIRRSVRPIETIATASRRVVH